MQSRILPVMIDAAMCFVQLQQVDYANVLHFCSASGPGSGIVGDGVVLNIRSLIAHLSNSWRATPDSTNKYKYALNGPDSVVFAFLPLSLVENTDIRGKLKEFKELLFNFSGHIRHNPQTKKDETHGKPLTAKKLEKLRSLLKELISTAGGVVSRRLALLEHLVNKEEEVELFQKKVCFYANKKAKDLLQALSSDYPVCSLCPLGQYTR